MATIKLSPAIEEYLAWKGTVGHAPNTIRIAAQTLTRTLTVAGNIYVHNITARHLDDVFVEMGKTRSRATLNGDLSHLRSFVSWCKDRRYMPDRNNPLAGRRAVRGQERPRLRVPVTDFGRLLGAAEARHPRDRIAVALGLYLFVRASEMRNLRIAEVNLVDGEIGITIQKSKLFDRMPICQELDQELRQWLTYYSSEQGKLDPNWLLVPSRESTGHLVDPLTRRFTSASADPGRLRPRQPIVHLQHIAKRALVDCGYPIRDESGKANGEGIHTLRRSGARALWDRLCEDKGDLAAGRQVQAMLHHANLTTTLHYIGVEQDKIARDRTIKGKMMYPVGTVTSLEARRAANDRHSAM